MLHKHRRQSTDGDIDLLHFSSNFMPHFDTWLANVGVTDIKKIMPLFHLVMPLPWHVILTIQGLLSISVLKMRPKHAKTFSVKTTWQIKSMQSRVKI